MFERLTAGQGRQIFVETDREAPIARELLEPHYSDRRFFRKMHTVFLDPLYEAAERDGNLWVKEAGYDYSDRLSQRYGHEANKAAREKAGETVRDHTSARFYEEFLRNIYGKPNLKLVHLVTGVNVSNGYPYKLFGTVDPAQPEVK